MKNQDPFDRLIAMSRRTPPPEPGGPPPFLHLRVMAAVRCAKQTAARRQWGELTLGSLPVAAAIAIICAWQRPLASVPETTAAMPEDPAGLIASALIDSTIPQP